MTDLYTALTLDDNALMKTVIENASVDVPEGTDMTRYVKAVCDDINTLTFNRITDYFGLTVFQQKTILSVCSGMLHFRYEHAAILDSVLKSYGINGVSMSFDDASVRMIDGVYVPGDVYALLRQTGLTCRAL